MSWNDVGNWLTSDGPPWWATLGVPVLTYYIGQRTSANATTEQREADAVQRKADRDAETERLREARTDEQKQADSTIRSNAFSAALDAIAQLTAELAQSGVERYAEPDTNAGQARILNPDDAVKPDAVRQFAGSVAKLRLYTTDEVLDVDGFLSDLTAYVTNWPYFGSDGHRELIDRLQVLSKAIGDLYRVRNF